MQKESGGWGLSESSYLLEGWVWCDNPAHPMSLLLTHPLPKVLDPRKNPHSPGTRLRGLRGTTRKQWKSICLLIYINPSKKTA